MQSKKILVIGSSNTDMTIRSKTLPKEGETLLGNDFRIGQGGKGANQAVAAKKLGGDVTFVCKVGRDLFGDNAVALYSESGLDPASVLRSSSPTGVAFITVDDEGKNSIVVASGANSDLLESDIEALRELISSADILLLQLETPIPSVVKAASIAHEAGAKVILNPAPAQTLPDELLASVSLLIPNETEAEKLTGVEIRDERGAIEAAKILKSKGVDEIIITLGSDGSLVFDGECDHVPARKVKALDTTAAGDTFCGALCVALSEGRTLLESVKFATKASSLSVQKMGAQDSIPTRAEVDSIMD